MSARRELRTCPTSVQQFNKNCLAPSFPGDLGCPVGIISATSTTSVLGNCYLFKAMAPIALGPDPPKPTRSIPVLQYMFNSFQGSSPNPRSCGVRCWQNYGLLAQSFWKFPQGNQQAYKSGSTDGLPSKSQCLLTWTPECLFRIWN